MQAAKFLQIESYLNGVLKVMLQEAIPVIGELDSLKKQIVIMHPGPINRGVELSSDAADSQHSIILDQVENGVAVRMAVLYLLAGAKG